MGQYLRFALGQGRYAVGLDRVREILEVGPLTPVPLMPECVRGVMNLRGAVVPVIDLGRRLGLGSAHIGRRTCIVMVDPGTANDSDSDRATPMGILVDAVDEVFAAGDTEHEAVPLLGTSVEPRYLRGLVRVRGEATPELDLSALLDPAALVRA